MAYASKYYDPVKRHEYYMKHRQLKGRTRQNRGSTASLNEYGKAAAAEVKERIQAELKAALARLPRRGATEQRKALRAQYQEKYYAELDKIKADPEFGKAKKATGGTRASSGTSGTRATRGSSGSTRQNQSKSEKKVAEKPKKTKAQIATEAMNKIINLQSSMASLSEEQQAQVQSRINALIEKIATKLNKQVGKVKEDVKAKKMSATKTADTMKTINSLVKKFNAMPAEAQEKMRSKIQSLINRLSAKLGIDATELSKNGTTLETSKSTSQSEEKKKKGKSTKEPNVSWQTERQRA